MGMEVPGADVPAAQVKVADGEDKLLGEIEVKVDTKVHEQEAVCTSEDCSADRNDVASNSVEHFDHVAPKDASTEWPEEKQMHTYFFIRYRSYEDPKLREKIDQAEKDCQKKAEARALVLQALKEKKSEKSGIIAKLRPLSEENKQYNIALNERIKNMTPLQNELGEFRSANRAAREKSTGLCSSEEELNLLIKSMEYRISHESISLDEEKKLLREMKQLEGTRSKVIASAAMRDQLKAAAKKNGAVQDQYDTIRADLDEVRKERQAVRDKIKVLEDELAVVDEQIAALEADLDSATAKRDKAFEAKHELRKSLALSNSCFHQNRALLDNAKGLSQRSEVKTLQELSHNELEKFMSQWNKNKSFREDYQKRITGSLNARLLSRDGRMRSPDEKPIMEQKQTSAQPAAEPSSETVKVTQKQAKEDTLGIAQALPPSVNEARGKEIGKVAEVSNVKAGKLDETSGDDFVVKTAKELVKPKEIDPEKLREIRRQEEIAKNKLALERKKKIAERKAAAAAAMAQKEADKKRKKEEKKSKKKGAESEEQTEDDKKSEEPMEESAEEAPAPPASDKKPPKDTVKRRGAAPKGGSQLPKVILKRKKSQAYPSWALPAAGAALALLAIALAVFAYFNHRTAAVI